ncbi:flavin reductase like domain-containing protein [Aspergillus coremiiformis]|uniref:Flavin reductase like domain-containing protein n=1 Tax=Aspergillus coremiiformis TaxID=138285 RepID=A0A5N6Z2P0_9EURO|nr:flavin reductase like domain-containing protein [Aspergillus coremiiformis]
MKPYSRPAVSVNRIVGQVKGFHRGSASTDLPLRAQQWHSRRTIRSAGATSPSPTLPRSQSGRANDPHDIENAALSLPDQVRLLMRRVPYPVAIITATDPHEPLEKAFRGMTVSSFNTVALHPEPAISFNVRRPSETLSALQSSNRFLVHLLAPSQLTAALARDFSKGNHNLSIVNGKGDFEFVPHTSASSEEASTRPLPLLRRKNPADAPEPDALSDIPFVFECRLHPKGIEVNDHTIVVGTVVKVLSDHLTSPDAIANAHSVTDLCLTYANTRFWEMGHEI